ncbi:MAG TPA: VOC family protein, partial [Acidobacteriota bacterium]|nr:VOC family protein [Acidobacteriota bacterium]
IQWNEDSVHPSSDSPQGCNLKFLEIQHPQAEKVRETLRTLGLDAKVTELETAKLIATLETPKGELKLS